MTKHLFFLQQVPESLWPLSAIAKRAYQNTPCQFPFAWLLRLRLVFVSYFHPFSVFLDVFKKGRRCLFADPMISAA